eukprot:CAMPEP_0113673814 /NCGR_PEP_ID=MMETSP0038_2-20120614/7061_1 /TAXON_ID=2898 /ORGANISM="Cryptomonas paramecium" /LENGTH=103 /DNA_ID=CAMNT_0000590303 /DNA_START=619 /DNA_END=930 /DNA_ORIENTATION=- /assembly_acc=CAM_ASM_000170
MQLPGMPKRCLIADRAGYCARQHSGAKHTPVGAMVPDAEHSKAHTTPAAKQFPPNVHSNGRSSLSTFIPYMMGGRHVAMQHAVEPPGAAQQSHKPVFHSAMIL